jgi:hypothetical protein
MAMHGLMARGIHGLPEVSLKLAIRLYLLQVATPEIVLWRGVAARRADGLRPSYYPLGYLMLYASASHADEEASVWDENGVVLSRSDRDPHALCLVGSQLKPGISAGHGQAIRRAATDLR